MMSLRLPLTIASRIFVTGLLLVAIVFGLLSASGTRAFAAATDSSALAREFAARYPRILVDARGSRGGNGDIAAAYLTLSDWFQNSDLQSKVTVLVDENGRTRLLKLAEGNDAFTSRVDIRLKEDGEIAEPFQLYLVFANPSGTYRYKDDFGKHFHFSSDATLMVQTVLGNTENQNSLHPYAIVENQGRIFDWGPAGLDGRESGIYTDVVAQGLRGKSNGELKTLLLEQTPTITDEFSRSAIEAVISTQKLAGAKVGLVYGISAEQTQKQFVSYLEGLKGRASDAFVLITPSKFREGDVHDPELKKSLKFITSIDQMPAIAESGQTYVIETKTLPHRVFVGLTALSMKSGVTPVGAGDGFLSAAVGLGEPFVLTQVPWNKSNIQRIRELLIELAVKYNLPSAEITTLKELLVRNYEKLDFKTALALKRYAPLFRLLQTKIPKLSTRLMEVALKASTYQDPKTIAPVGDFVLQTSILRGGRPGLVTRSRASLLCEAVFAN